jgi:hypothetical protein
MKAIFLCLLLLTAGCDKYGLSVQQQYVDVRYLASTHVGTPDPRQSHPPVGQQLVVEWHVPNALLKEEPRAVLHVIYWDLSERSFTFPIAYRTGYSTYALLDADYERTGGILTYRAEILTGAGEVYKEWVHQLWVRLITLEEAEQRG